MFWRCCESNVVKGERHGQAPMQKMLLSIKDYGLIKNEYEQIFSAILKTDENEGKNAPTEM